MRLYSPITIRPAALAAACLAFATPAAAEFFVDIGAQSSRIEADIATIDGSVDSTEAGLHLGLGASRRVGSRGEIGARLELDALGSDLLLAVRAFDYRYHLSERFAVGTFLGAARLDLATPAYGYYLGAGIEVADVLGDWNLGLDLRVGDKVARDNILPTDPQGGAPDNFYDITGVSVYLSRRF